MPFQPHCLAEPGHIAQHRIEPAPGEGHRGRIEQEIGILLHPQRLPDSPRQNPVESLALGPRDQPAEHFGVAGAVGKALAVGPVLADRRQVGIDIARPGIARRARGQPQGVAHRADARIGIGVLLAEIERGGHVHHLAQRGVGKAAALQLRNQIGHRRGGIEPAFVDQHFRQSSDEALGHRKGDVRRIRPGDAKVTFIDDRALVHHQHRIGEIDGQRFRPGQLAAIVHRGKAHRVDIVAQRHRQVPHRPLPARDPRGRQEFAHVGIGIAVGRKAHVIRPLPRQPLVGRRRQPFHPAHDGGIGGVGIKDLVGHRSLLFGREISHMEPLRQMLLTQRRKGAKTSGVRRSRSHPAPSRVCRAAIATEPSARRKIFAPLRLCVSFISSTGRGSPRSRSA